MAEANKTYGFTIAVKELRETVPNIFRYASAYKRVNGLESKGLWEMFVEKPPQDEEKDDKKKEPIPEELDDIKPPEIDKETMEGEKYNMCHFWSNFEIARLDFFRSKEYEDFFEMMDRSGGFWMERVGYYIRLFLHQILIDYSGEMRQFIPWPLVHYLHLVISTTSETLATATRRFSTAQRTHPLGNYLAFLFWKRRLKMKRKGLKKTTTGPHLTPSKKTEWVADADATQTLSTSKGNKEVAWQNGLTLQVAGPPLECESLSLSLFMYRPTVVHT